MTLPPGPRLPVLVQTVLLWTRRHRYLPWAQRRYGDVFTLHALPGGTVVVVADPALTREVFRLPVSVAHAGEANAVLGPVLGEH